MAETFIPLWECLIILRVGVLIGEFIGDLNGMFGRTIGGLVGEIGVLIGKIIGGVGETIGDANGEFKGG